MPRMALSLFAGSTITVFLYFFLYSLISAGTEIFSSEAPAKIEFQRLLIPDEQTEKVRPKPEREKPEPPPPTEGVVQEPSEEVNTISPFEVVAPSGLIGGGVGIGGLNIGRAAGEFSMRGTTSADQQLMPLVRINPEYPEGAKMRGTEGYVILEFTITTSGSVRDPRVLKAEPSSVFNRAAIQAVRRWKYSPQVENGQAVEKVQQVKLRFELPKGGAQ